MRAVDVRISRTRLEMLVIDMIHHLGWASPSENPLLKRQVPGAEAEDALSALTFHWEPLGFWHLVLLNDGWERGSTPRFPSLAQRAHALDESAPTFEVFGLSEFICRLA